MRTILVHLNITPPGGASAESIADQLKGALEVGIDPIHAPDLAGSDVIVVLAEEVA